jgi:hypothetical protein
MAGVASSAPKPAPAARNFLRLAEIIICRSLLRGFKARELWSGTTATDRQIGRAFRLRQEKSNIKQYLRGILNYLDASCSLE